jgi:hypothetical protein
MISMIRRFVDYRGRRGKGHLMKEGESVSACRMEFWLKDSKAWPTEKTPIIDCKWCLKDNSPERILMEHLKTQ